MGPVYCLNDVYLGIVAEWWTPVYCLNGCLGIMAEWWAPVYCLNAVWLGILVGWWVPVVSECQPVYTGWVVGPCIVWMMCNLFNNFIYVYFIKYLLFNNFLFLGGRLNYIKLTHIAELLRLAHTPYLRVVEVGPDSISQSCWDWPRLHISELLRLVQTPYLRIVEVGTDSISQELLRLAQTPYLRVVEVGSDSISQELLRLAQTPYLNELLRLAHRLHYLFYLTVLYSTTWVVDQQFMTWMSARVYWLNGGTIYCQNV